jgi:DNA-binding MarR family transcriptional regulator
MSSQVLSPQQSTVLAVWVRLLRGHSFASREMNKQLNDDHGISLSDFQTLLLLSRADRGMMRRIDLAGELQLTASGVTKLLDGLQVAGYVDKANCSSDARVTYAVLTEAGREKLASCTCSHISAIQGMLDDRYTDEELATLAELLGRLAGDIGDESCGLAEQPAASATQ